MGDLLSTKQVSAVEALNCFKPWMKQENAVHQFRCIQVLQAFVDGSSSQPLEGMLHAELTSARWVERLTKLSKASKHPHIRPAMCDLLFCWRERLAPAEWAAAYDGVLQTIQASLPQPQGDIAPAPSTRPSNPTADRQPDALPSSQSAMSGALPRYPPTTPPAGAFTAQAPLYSSGSASLLSTRGSQGASQASTHPHPQQQQQLQFQQQQYQQQQQWQQQYQQQQQQQWQQQQQQQQASSMRQPPQQALSTPTPLHSSYQPSNSGHSQSYPSLQQQPQQQQHPQPQQHMQRFQSAPHQAPTPPHSNRNNPRDMPRTASQPQPSYPPTYPQAYPGPNANHPADPRVTFGQPSYTSEEDQQQQQQQVQQLRQRQHSGQQQQHPQHQQFPQQAGFFQPPQQQLMPASSRSLNDSGGPTPGLHTAESMDLDAALISSQASEAAGARQGWTSCMP
ncbi:MAG: hypothetical protein WDW38_005180 [Sanguina aurantia]